MELNIVPFAFHTDAQQEPALGIKIQPELLWQKVHKSVRIQFKAGPPKTIVIADSIPIPQGSDQQQRAIGEDIKGLLPSWVQIAVDDSGFGQPAVKFVSENNIWVAVSTDIHRFQVLGLHDLDSKDICSLLALAALQRFLALDDCCQSLGADRCLDLIELLQSEFNVVEFNTRLHRN